MRTFKDEKDFPDVEEDMEEEEEEEEEEEDEKEGEDDETVLKYTKKEILDRFLRGKTTIYGTVENMAEVHKIVEKTTVDFNTTRNELLEEYYFNSEEGEKDTITVGSEQVQLNSIMPRVNSQGNLLLPEDEREVELTYQQNYVSQMVDKMKV